MMTDQADGPPSSKRVKKNQNDGDYNFSALDDLPDNLLIPTNNGMLPHSNTAPIHERHQNLTALLSSNSPQKDIQNSLGNNIMNNYSGPGPGVGKYHNGPSVSNYVNTNYGNVPPGYNMNASYSTNANQMYSQSQLGGYSGTIQHSLSQMPNTGPMQQQPGMQQSMMQQQSSMPNQQHGMMGNQHMQHHTNMSAVLNGPSPAMSNGIVRPMSAGNINPRQTTSMQAMSNGPQSHQAVNGPIHQMPQSHSAGVGPPPQTPRPPVPVGTTAEAEKRKLIQQQLVLLLHAHKCQRRERTNGDMSTERACTLPHCKTMKSVLQHMTTCTEGKQCQVNHCASSRQIIAHWRSCSRGDCPVCLPLKNANERRNNVPGPPTNLNQLQQSLPSNMPPPSSWSQTQCPPTGPLPPQPTPQMQPVPAQPRMNVPQSSQNSVPLGLPAQLPPNAMQPSAIPPNISAPDMKKTYDLLGLNFFNEYLNQSPGTKKPQPSGYDIIHPTPVSRDQPTKEWHKNVTMELRNHLVHKLIQAIFPSPNPEVLNDPRMNNLIQYARKVEIDMYMAANSREEYYHMLAEKIYKVQKELEEKRKSRQKLQVQPGPGLPQHSSQPNLANSIAAPPGYPASQQSTTQLSNPGSAQSYSGPPSVGPASNFSSASLMSPPMAGTTGIPVETALQESKNALQELKKRQQLLQETKVEVKPDIKLEVEKYNPDVKMEIKTESVKDEPPQAIKTEAVELKEKPMTPSRPGSQKKTFTADELRQALMPTLEKLLLQEESIPFRQPVDAEKLGIPDYYDIIKKPMDLATIKNKLDTGQYTDPWQYCDDVWLMFENAWMYNRKTSRVYKWCSKLSEVFEPIIDSVMVKLGFCCGRRYNFLPQTLCCYGKQLCTINKDQVYYIYENRYVFCEKCFDDIQSNVVELSDEPTDNPILIPKDQFMKAKNDHLEPEKFTHCTDCGRKFHNICVLHMDQIWPMGYTCDNCLKIKGAKRKDNRFTAKRLPNSKLGVYLENRVNNFLKTRNVQGSGEVIIRVLASSDKETEVKPGMKERFPNLPNSYPYRCKAMFAFEDIDGHEVCFFGMHVQEYDSNCIAPNTGRVYVSYLDSVHFFQPREYRTAVYHEILIGYLEYCKTLGFNWGHIWACPPSEGDDYIFHCHPQEQKIPKPKRLQEWYKKMLDKAMVDKVVVDYKDIHKDAVEKGLQSATDLPYFEGDYWPNVLEESIKELEQEEEEKRKREEAEAAAAAQDDESDFGGDEENFTEVSGSGKKQGKKTTQKKKGTKKTTRKNNKKLSSHPGTDLSTKVLSAMEKHKDVFFVIKLQPHSSVKQLPITDVDPLIPCDLMDGRDAFLTMAREKHWEFSTLRRCTYSTMAMLHEIHTSSRDAFVYTCNVCKGQVETRYHCTVCEDFDMCTVCYKRDGHAHKMDRLALIVDEENSADTQTPAASRKASLQRSIQSLVHACQCRDANCRLPSCPNMKKIVNHTKSCKKKSQGDCSLCKQFIGLCLCHARSCNESKCPVPYCQSIKEKLRQQAQNARQQQTMSLRRRMAAMQAHASGAPASTQNRTIHSTNPTIAQADQTSNGGGKPCPSAPPGAMTAAISAVSAARAQATAPINNQPQAPGLAPSARPGMMQQGNNPAVNMQGPTQQINTGYAQVRPSYGAHQANMQMNGTNGMMSQPQMMAGQEVWMDPAPPQAPVYNNPQMPAQSMQQMGHPQMRMPNQSVHNMAPGRPHVHQLIDQLKQPNSPGELSELMRKNPDLVNQIIKQKHAQSLQSQPHMNNPNNMAPGMLSQQMAMQTPQQMNQQMVSGPMPPGSNQPAVHSALQHQQQRPLQPMHSAMPPEMWQVRQPTRQPSHLYTQTLPSNPPYQQQVAQPRPQFAQYGMSQPRYQTQDPQMMSHVSRPVLQHHQQQMRSAPPAMLQNQMLQQVRSPPNMMAQHTRSPQPMQSPRQQAVASPALMQSVQDNMMMQPGTPGQHPYQMSMAQPPTDYDTAQFSNQPSDGLTPQETLSKFVDSL